MRTRSPTPANCVRLSTPEPGGVGVLGGQGDVPSPRGKGRSLEDPTSSRPLGSPELPDLLGLSWGKGGAGLQGAKGGWF